MTDNNLKVAPDVPQELLSVFNRIDFAKAGLKKMMLLKGLKQWADKNMPKKNLNKQYKSNGDKKKLSRDFDPRLLNLINAYDYEGQDLTEVIAWLNEFVEKELPLKQKK